jgi:hypothetical protein
VLFGVWIATTGMRLNEKFQLMDWRVSDLITTLVDAFLYALVKGGFFGLVMQVVEKT